MLIVKYSQTMKFLFNIQNNNIFQLPLDLKGIQETKSGYNSKSKKSKIAE
jgi:hypothetical protein